MRASVSSRLIVITIVHRAVRECASSQMCQCKSHSRLTEVQFDIDGRRRVGRASPQIVRGGMSMRLTLVGPIIVAACAVVMCHSATTGRAAEECLSAPKGAAPAGRHWYYRSDAATGRRCWYLADKSKKARQASSPPTPVRRPEPVSVEGPAAVVSTDAPALASAETTPLPAGAIAPPVAPPSDVVAQFSRQWPHYERPSGTVGRAPESNVVGDTEETPPATAEQKDIPVVQPVLAAQEPVAANAPSAPILNTTQMFVLLICSLCLAGVIMGLVCAASSIRTRRRIARTWEAPTAGPWQESAGTGYRPAEMRAGHRAPEKGTGSRAAEPKVSAPPAQSRGAEIPRPDELETNLQELLDGWRRRAA